jgi:Cu-processing system ATP-binding protein
VALAVALRGVCKRYGAKEVVREVDLAIEPGESLALLGHNGAGKTTLIKLMLGLTRPSAGSVRVLGEDPTAASSVRLRHVVGFLPENVAFHDAMTGREVLAFYARLKRAPATECEALLERVGLAEAARQRVRTYSKGMRQRLGLAQALLGHPQLLLLDEPTTGLDPALRRKFYDLIKAMQHTGTTVLLCSHALTEIEARTDRVAIMKQGKLTVCGTLEELRRQTRLPVRIRMSVTPGEAGTVAERLGDKVEFHKVNACRLDLWCFATDKMEVLRRITDMGNSVQDVDILPPRLEDIYAHFTDEPGVL